MTELRNISGLEEISACVTLQRVTWGEEFSDIVPGSVLQVTQKIGGLLAGAFEGDALVGFVYSFLGRFEGEVCHWSHMLAVHPSARGQGLGRRLKLLQRERVLEDGISAVFWTFDPLVARNAYVNLNRLGASVLRYVPNMYGADTGSPLHAGGDTDRFIVRWDLASRRARWAIDEEPASQTALPPDEDCVVAPPEAGGTDDPVPEGDEVYVEVPADLEAAVAGGVDVGRWRARVRHAFSTYLGRGYDVQSIARDTDADRCYYFLRRI